MNINCIYNFQTEKLNILIQSYRGIGLTAHPRNNMKLHTMNLSITTLLIFCISFGRSILVNYAWSDNLVLQLKQDTKVNQLLLLYEDSKKNDICQLAMNVMRIIPTRLLHFENIMIENGQKLRLPSYMMEATKIIIISTRNNNRNLSNIVNLLNSIATLSKPKMLPKVLIAIQVANNRRYREFFQLLWPQQFLDVTILELKYRIEGETVLTANLNSGIPELHYYNPFTEISVKTTFSRNSSLFPNKLRDLHGYKVNAGIFHYPPFVYVNRNSPGYVLDVHGPEVDLMIQLSNTVKFSVKKVVADYQSWTPVSCTKENNTGLSKGIIYNEVQFMAVQSGMIKTCFTKFAYIIKGTRFLNIIILVPILSIEAEVLTTQWNFYSVIVIFCLFLIPWMIAQILNFDQRYWKLMYMIQVALGSTTPQISRKFVERVVLLTLVCFYFLQSSFIFTTFSNLQLQKQSSKKMESLEDLIASNLTFIIHYTKHGIEQNDDNDAYQKLMKNAIFSEKSFEECAKILMEYQNVSCVGREQTFYW